jgi:hypothetical protein
MRERVINLDQPSERDTVVVVRFGGAVVPVSRARLLELLSREQLYILGAGGDAPERTDAAEVAAPQHLSASSEPPAMSALAGERLNHRSLSNRIKKIHDYSVAQRTLRPNHALHLEEVLRAFDWVVPEHPNTQLEFHLGEICGWGGVSDALKSLIQSFVAQYKQVRYRSPA